MHIKRIGIRTKMINSNLTRQEFSNLLIYTKNKASVLLGEALIFAAQLSFKKIEVIESGQKEFNLSDALLYLRMCNSTLELAGYDLVYADTLADIGTFLRNNRETYEWSVVDIARRSHVSSKIIYAFEKGRCDLKIDTFLKLINAMNITIKID